MVVWFGDAFPIGTLVVNVIGCCLLGFVAQFGIESTSLSKETREVIGVGFLGGLTTFSTFGWETFRRLQEGLWGVAAGNVAAIENLSPYRIRLALAPVTPVMTGRSASSSAALNRCGG